MTDAITRERRTKLLTPRVRAIMRAFNKNAKYLSDATPNITWDDSFIPPDLYVNLHSKLASLDAKESQQSQKEREKEKAREDQRQNMEKQKANVAQNDNRKAKETPQDLDDAENPIDMRPRRTTRQRRRIHRSTKRTPMTQKSSRENGCGRLPRAAWCLISPATKINHLGLRRTTREKERIQHKTKRTPITRKTSNKNGHGRLPGAVWRFLVSQ